MITYLKLSLAATKFMYSIRMHALPFSHVFNLAKTVGLIIYLMWMLSIYLRARVNLFLGLIPYYLNPFFCCRKMVSPCLYRHWCSRYQIRPTSSRFSLQKFPTDERSWRFSDILLWIRSRKACYRFLWFPHWDKDPKMWSMWIWMLYTTNWSEREKMYLTCRKFICESHLEKGTLKMKRLARKFNHYL